MKRKRGNRIDYVTWREGRPRFVPGPKARDAGWKGQDLRHDDGTWFSWAEARAWSKAHAAALTEKRTEPLRARNERSCDAVFESLMASMFMAENAAATHEDYRKKWRALLGFAPEFATTHVRALTRPIVLALAQKAFSAGKSAAVVQGMMRILSLICSHAERLGFRADNSNPCFRLGLPHAKPRTVLHEDFEVRAIITALDYLGWHNVADGVMLALFTGQRQADRLSMTDAGRDSRGRLLVAQQKTGVIVAVPEAPELVRRLDAMRERRKRKGIVSDYFIVEERRPVDRRRVNAGDEKRTGLPLDAHAYRHAYRDGRALAIKGFIDADGVEHLPCPTLQFKRDQDYRDTAVTWLALSECTIPEICSITGHSLQSAHSIMRHYLVMHPEMADSAIGKLVSWMEKTGRRVA